MAPLDKILAASVTAVSLLLVCLAVSLIAAYKSATDRTKREQAAREVAFQTRLELATKQHEKLLEKANASSDSEALVVMRRQVKALQQEVREARNREDDYFVQIVKLNDTINQLRGVQSQGDDSVRLAEQIRRAEAVLMADHLEMYSPIGPPKVDGLVMAVLRDRVEISIGSDEGLKPGAKLDVWRGATYVGRIIVRRTEPDQAVGDAIPAFRRSDPRRGDRVELPDR